MMNKLNLNKMLIAIAFSCLSSSLFAQTTAPFDGFYFGGSVGGTSTMVDHDQLVLAFVDDGGADFVQEYLQMDGPIVLKTSNSFKGALYAGFGKCWDYWYLGTEIFVDLARYKNWDSVEADEYITEGGAALAGVIELQGDTHTKLSNFQYGIDLRPGVVLLPDFMIYGRIGVAFGDLNLNTNSILAGVDLGFPASWDLNLPLTTEKDFAALRLGAGFEQNICPRLNCRLDYVYTYYGKAGVAGGPISSDLTPPQGAEVDLGSATSVKIYNHTMMLGLSYLFN